MAQRLHLSDRTLNRRLQDESASFRELRAQVTNRWARQYLDATDLSIDAIAAQLGYRDAANFRRAFRNANACSPSDYRQRAAIEAPRGSSDQADDRLSG